jgi:hypothetical protein
VQKEQEQMAEYMDMFDFLAPSKGQHSSCTGSQRNFADPVKLFSFLASPT